MVLRFDVFITSPDRNTDLEIVKRDDHEFAIFTEFIFTWQRKYYWYLFDYHSVRIVWHLFDTSILLISVDIAISNAIK